MGGVTYGISTDGSIDVKCLEVENCEGAAVNL